MDVSLLTASKPALGEVSYETDRMRFIGRGRTTAEPLALDDNAALSGSAGPVLDPVAAIRCRITLDAGKTAIVDLVTGVSETRDGCVKLVARYQDRQMADRVLAAAPAHGQAVLSGLHASESDAQLYTRLAGYVIYANASLRADPNVLGQNRQGQSGLWGYAISGDLPIVLLRIADAANIDMARQLVQAHGYWRLHGLAVDLVIVSENHDGPSPTIQERITKQIAACGDGGSIDQPGGIFVRPAGKIPDTDYVLLQTVARIVISDRDGSLAQQLIRRCAAPSATPPAPAARSDITGVRTTSESPGAAPERDLIFPTGSAGSLRTDASMSSRSRPDK